MKLKETEEKKLEKWKGKLKETAKKEGEGTKSEYQMVKLRKLRGLSWERENQKVKWWGFEKERLKEESSE